MEQIQRRPPEEIYIVKPESDIQLTQADKGFVQFVVKKRNILARIYAQSFLRNGCY